MLAPAIFIIVSRAASQEAMQTTSSRGGRRPAMLESAAST